MNKALSIIIVVLFAGVIFVNAAANIVPINGYNTGQLSDMLPNLFVPTGLTFAIWGVIYTLLLIMVVINCIDSFKERNPGNAFQAAIAANFILNAGWIFAWHYRLILPSVIIMLGILGSLAVIDWRIKHKEATLEVQFSPVYKTAVSVYYGWISVATIANITALLVDFGWKGWPLNQSMWAVLVLLIGTVIASLKLLKDFDILYGIVFIWAYAGIIIKRIQAPVFYFEIIFAAAAGIIILLGLGYYSVKVSLEHK